MIKAIDKSVRMVVSILTDIWFHISGLIAWLVPIFVLAVLIVLGYQTILGIGWLIHVIWVTPSLHIVREILGVMFILVMLVLAYESRLDKNRYPDR